VRVGAAHPSTTLCKRLKICVSAPWLDKWEVESHVHTRGCSLWTFIIAMKWLFKLNFRCVSLRGGRPVWVFFGFLYQPWYGRLNWKSVALLWEVGGLCELAPCFLKALWQLGVSLSDESHVLHHDLWGEQGSSETGFVSMRPCYFACSTQLKWSACGVVTGKDTKLSHIGNVHTASINVLAGQVKQVTHRRHICCKYQKSNFRESTKLSHGTLVHAYCKYHMAQ